MVLLKSLRIVNFKRFHGDVEIGLRGEGPITVVAAQNGVGKTTILDAISIALHGKRAFAERYPGRSFHHWLLNAYNVDAERAVGARIVLAISILNDQGIPVTVERTYWLDFEEESVHEEINVRLRGSLLVIEAGEQKDTLSEAWVERTLPRAVARRLFVDGERLDEFDVRTVQAEMEHGVDDLVGLGQVHRLRRHLAAVRRKLIRDAAPGTAKRELDSLLLSLEDRGSSIEQLQEDVQNLRTRARHARLRRDELMDRLQHRHELGGGSTDLHVRHAKQNSELAQSRMEIKSRVESDLPFRLAGAPIDLDDLGFELAKETATAARDRSIRAAFLEELIEAANIEAATASRLRKKGGELLAGEQGAQETPLSQLPLTELESVLYSHQAFSLAEPPTGLRHILDLGLSRLRALLETEDELRYATEGQLGDLARELQEVSSEYGVAQADLLTSKKRLDEAISTHTAVQEQIEALHAFIGMESVLSRKLKLIEVLDARLLAYVRERRAKLASTLAAHFSEAFTLLSRKADRLLAASIDPYSYRTELSMRGFPGNWLDRDLSATECQHVGLSLLYALRAASAVPAPVVVDTPTSRMDREHKSWSITRFYPRLADQVIILATSDDLSNGLYDELRDSGAIGHEVLLEETSEHRVAASAMRLDSFF